MEKIGFELLIDAFMNTCGDCGLTRKRLEFCELPSKYKYDYREYCTVGGLKFSPDEKICIDLTEINDLIYK